MKAAIFNYSIIKPFAYFGLTEFWWDIHIDTLFQTWIMMGILIIGICAGRFIMRSSRCMYAQQAILICVGFFVDLIEETCGSFKKDIFFFVVTIFLFIVGSGLTGLLPYVGEATQDLNTTFALGISSFCFSQYQGVKAHGLSHFKEFLQPFFLLLPLNIIGELAKAASMSFRLFGNILGGSIMVDLILHALGAAKELYISAFCCLLLISFILYKTPLLRYFQLNPVQTFYKIFFFFILIVPGIQLFFGVVESFVQAFVLTTLTITYSSMAIGFENNQGNMQQVVEELSI